MDIDEQFFYSFLHPRINFSWKLLGSYVKYLLGSFRSLHSIQLMDPQVMGVDGLMGN